MNFLLKKNKINSLAIAAIVIVSTIIYHAWFYNFAILTSGDWSYYTKETASTLRIDYFSTWLSDYSFGRVLIDGGQALTYSAYGLFAKYLGLDYAVSERIIHLWPSVLISVLSSYFLTRYIFKKQLPAIIGSLVYSFNVYALTLQTGHLTLSVAYATIPLIVLFYLKIVYERKFIYSILASLSLTLCSAYEPRELYLVLWVVFIISMGSLLIRGAIFSKRNLKLAMLLLVPIFIVILLNSYWILGLLFNGGSIGEGVLNRGLFGDEYFNILQAIALFHPYWNGSEPIPFVINNIPYYFWIIPIFAILGFIFLKKRKIILFFFLIGLIGILLTKQSGSPFPSFYEWLFLHLPGFNAYREASKFYMYIALSYSVLIGGLIYYLQKKSLRKIYLVPILLTILSVYIVNLIPIINTTIGTTFVARSEPDSYKEINNIIESDKEYGRVYWLPRESRWSTSSNIHPRVSGVDIVNSSWNSIYNQDDLFTTLTSRQQIETAFNKNFSEKLFNDGGIKYFVVPLRDTQNNDNFYVHYGGERNVYVDLLDNQPYLKKIPTKNSDIAIYLNQNFKPYFTASENIYGLKNINELESSLNFLSKSGVNTSESDFYLSDSKLRDTGYLSDLLASPDRSNIVNDSLNSSDFKGNLYERNYVEFYYTIQNGKISFISQGQDLLNRTIDEKKVLATFDIDPRDSTYLIIDSKQIKISNNDTEERFIGTNIKDIELYHPDENKNLIVNPSFENGAWNKDVKNCDPYDSQAVFSQEVSRDHTDGSQSLKLSARTNVACNESNAMKLSSRYYSVEFDYKLFETKRASYMLSTNGKDRNKDIYSESGEWQSYISINELDDSDSLITLKIASKPSDQEKQTAENYYDNVKVFNLEKIGSVPIEENSFFKTTFSDRKITVKNNAYSYKNLINNASLENGLWKDKVGDCDAYDNKAQIGMKLNTYGTDGNKSLSLSAKNHIACTGPNKINVAELRKYLFDFDYKSTNADFAGYSISFDDPQKTVVSKRISVKNNKWSKYTTNFTVPIGARSGIITFYSYSKNGNEEIVTEYDNLFLTKIPELNEVFVSYEKDNLKGGFTGNIISTIESTTERKVEIRNVSQSFYLKMSEQYHAGWSAKIISSSKTQILDDIDHINLNNFQNAWYVDLNKYCNDNTACTKNPDGTYDIQMLIVFKPQKYFNYGLVISSVTTLILIIILFTYGYKKIRATHYSNEK